NWDDSLGDYLVLALCITNSHAKRHVLAVTHWRKNKEEQRPSKPRTANNRNDAAKNTDDRCDKRSCPGNPHRQHCNWTTARRSGVRWHSARRTNTLTCFISFSTPIANGHRNLLTGNISYGFQVPSAVPSGLPSTTV